MAVASQKAAKKVVKKAAPKRARRARSTSRYAGRIAPPLVTEKVAEPVVVHVAVESTLSAASEVKIVDFRNEMRMYAITHGFSRPYNAICVRAHSISTRGVRLKQTREAMRLPGDPNEKQLHRRVRVAVYDAANVRISSASYDLAATDFLSFEVTGNTVSGVVSTADAR